MHTCFSVESTLLFLQCSRSLGQSFIHVIKLKVKSDKPLTEET